MFVPDKLPFELGGSPDIDVEDAVLAAHGIPTSTRLEARLVGLESTDPIDMDGVRSVRGFSLTALPSESIDQQLDIRPL